MSRVYLRRPVVPMRPSPMREPEASRLDEVLGLASILVALAIPVLVYVILAAIS